MSDEIEEIKNEEKEKISAAEEEGQQDESTITEHDDRNYSWIAGLVIIVVGVIFLLSNFTGFTLNNWWALFILIPGIMSFINAWNAYRKDGRWSKRARGGLIGGLIISFVAVIFLFNLDWGKVWPFFLIMGGLAALLGGWFDR